LKKLLVANRGEIAIRIMRSAREMGIRTVAVYSEADRLSRHVLCADEAYLIGPAASAQSYLNVDKIIEVIKTCGADAVHPGYGFLSENATFARRCKKEGITLVGPSPEAMEVMGSKLAAKEAVKKFNVPLVPGTEGAVSDLNEAKSVAKEIGFPLLIKASAGGGGKGMRIVEKEEELEEMLKLAMSEAKNAFGDSSVFIERYITSPKHIEVQILGDQHGNIVYLFERECSIQRRHQKVIEEAPSMVVNDKLRKEIGECAVMVAKSCGYTNAGTVEFIMDESKNYFFLEMNTRLQVEHPVTEMITGKDLVKEQIKIARGEALSFTQEDLKINGHAIEVRVYAEDPMNNFLPDIGTIEQYIRPDGIGIRVDDGYVQGDSIPIYYDPMISKLIVHAPNRNEAIERMIRAIEEYQIQGVKTTLAFCKMVLDHKVFRNGKFDTHFVKNHFKPEMLQSADSDEMEMAALLAAFMQQNKSTSPQTKGLVASGSNWKKNRLQD